jgi:hypothetical protein
MKNASPNSSARSRCVAMGATIINDVSNQAITHVGIALTLFTGT